MCPMHKRKKKKEKVRMSQKVWGDLGSCEKFGAGAASQGVTSKSESSSEEPEIFRL